VRFLASIGVVAILLTFMIQPVYSQTPFDQTFTWNVTRVLAGVNRMDSPWYPIPVGTARTVNLLYFEVRTILNNNGPAAFAFDIYAQFVTPPPTYHVYSLLPSFYVGKSAIVQRVSLGSVPQGWTAEVTFSIDFSRSTFHLGPGAVLADASGINYTDNRLAVTIGDAFGASFGLEGTTPNGYITLGPISSIQVKGASVSIPEFEAAFMMLTLTVFVTALALTQVKRIRNNRRRLVSTSSWNGVF
jgi:hypothetical protein